MTLISASEVSSEANRWMKIDKTHGMNVRLYYGLWNNLY